MVATRAIQKKFVELGRLRIGDREPNASGKGTHPHKLTTFRITSANGSLLHYAAARYGGSVEPWDDEWAPKDEFGRPTQFELYTTTPELAILIPTFSAITLAFERWSASGCQQRCTGERITHCPLNEALLGTACTCPEDDTERAELAQAGKACARILRLNVLLPDLPGMGVWRLETKGFYATAELLGTLDTLQMAGQEHTIIEAMLRLEQRTVKRPGKGEGKGTLHFAVPVLVPTYTPRQLLSGAATVLLTPPPTPAPPVPLAENIALLYGDTDRPAGADAAPTIAQIEAAILAHPGGDVEQWYRWAENHYLKKPRAQFTVADYQQLLQAVRDRIARRHQQATQEGAGATQTPGEVAEAAPPPEAPTGESGASQQPSEATWVDPQRNLLAEEEYGNDA